MGFFWAKYLIFEFEKYWVDMFDGIENLCKVWGKTDLCFPKWREEFDKFSPEHLKNIEIGTSVGSFYLN